ncbi:unnamed protein product [Camellia sinensis]
MLHRTHHPLFFSYNPFTTTTTTSPVPPRLLSPPIQGMECAEAALKNCTSPEVMAVKKTQQQQQPPAFLDELPAINGVSGDDSFVDDLLDFSKGGIEDGFLETEDEPEDETKPCSVSVFPQQQDQKAEKPNHSDPTKTSTFSVTDDFRSELSVPADDLADLEWLSHFVEDSFSEYSLAGKLPDKTTGNRSEPLEIAVLAKSCFTTPVQTKARSKRLRTGSRVWSLGSPSLTETTSSSSSSSSTLSSSPPNPWLIFTTLSQTADSLLRPPLPAAKKPKRKRQEIPGGGGGGSQQPRRCSHCLVQKTPQWRTGPLGAKTLCNACGVRYKSGRLLPEYRPACSPTFSGDIHSNNHRKVLEMRRKKEVETGLGPPVQSF